MSNLSMKAFWIDLDIDVEQLFYVTLVELFFAPR